MPIPVLLQARSTSRPWSASTRRPRSSPGTSISGAARSSTSCRTAGSWRSWHGLGKPVLPPEVGGAWPADGRHQEQGGHHPAADGRRRGLQGGHPGPAALRRAPGAPHPRRGPHPDQDPVEWGHHRRPAADLLHPVGVGDPGHPGRRAPSSPGRPARRRDADPLDALHRQPGLVLLPRLHALAEHRAGHHRQRERHAEPPPARGRLPVGDQPLGGVPGVPACTWPPSPPRRA